ncbi:MAG: hypothetical protein ACTHJW_08730 [Streptosporangiaceae bacterium]
MALLKIGCNAGIWVQVIDDVPGNTGVRSYRDTVNEIPRVWPGVDGSLHTMVSLRPHPDDLLAGRLDTQILNLLAAATPGAYLTVWHEAGNLYGHGDTNPATNPNFYFITPTSVRKMHVKMQDLVGQSGADVRYGCCIYGTITKMANWIPHTGHPLDFYSIDVYDNNKSNNGSNFRTRWPDGRIDPDKVNAYLDEFKALAKDRSGLQNPEICILECNSPVIEHRRWFFRSLADWLFNNGGTRLYTFFKDGGASGGQWLDPPAGQTTVDGLNYIYKTYGKASDPPPPASSPGGGAGR